MEKKEKKHVEDNLVKLTVELDTVITKKLNSKILSHELSLSCHTHCSLNFFPHMKVAENETRGRCFLIQIKFMIFAKSQSKANLYEI